MAINEHINDSAMRRSKAEPNQSAYKRDGNLATVSSEQVELAALSELSRCFVEVIPRSMWSIRYGMREAAGKDLSVPQFRVMATLWQRSRTNGELAEQMGVSVPAMSRMVDGLVEAGYVIRVPQDHDRRQVKLELSLAGRRTFRRIQKHTHELFVSRFSGLNAGQRQGLQDGLSVLEILFPNR